MLNKNTIVNKVFLVSILLLCSCDNDVVIAYSHKEIENFAIVTILLLTVILIGIIYIFLRTVTNKKQ